MTTPTVPRQTRTATCRVCGRAIAVNGDTLRVHHDTRGPRTVSCPGGGQPVETRPRLVMVTGRDGVRRPVDPATYRLPTGVRLTSVWDRLPKDAQHVILAQLDAEQAAVRAAADRQRDRHAREAGAPITEDPHAKAHRQVLLEATEDDRSLDLSPWRTPAEQRWTDNELRAAHAARHSPYPLTADQVEANRAYHRIARRRSRGVVTNPDALRDRP